MSETQREREHGTPIVSSGRRRRSRWSISFFSRVFVWLLTFFGVTFCVACLCAKGQETPSVVETQSPISGSTSGLASAPVSVATHDSNAAGLLPAYRFRISNQVAVDDHVTRSTTIFYDGLVYDFIDPNGQITVYDRAGATLTVLDPSSRLQMQISLAELEKDVEKKRESYQKSDNYLSNYLAKPYFEENGYEEESGIMVFRSPWVEYRFETVSLSDPVVAGVYYDYCQKSTLLNIRTSGAPSPMIRFVINPTLEQRQRFPTKVSLTLYPKGKVLVAAHSMKAESTHTFARRLQPADEQKIGQAREYQKLFRIIPIDDYCREVILEKSLKSSSQQ